MQSCSFNCNVTCVDIDTLPPMQARVIVTERPDPNVDDSTIIRTFPCLQHTSILCHTIIIGSHCKLHLVTAEVTYSLSQPDRAYLAISEVCAREAGDGVHVSVRLAIMSPLARLRVTGWHGPGHEDFSNKSWKRNLPEPSGEPPETVDTMEIVFYASY